MVTIRDVAEAAGVSTATVTRAMTSPEKVSDKLLGRVERAIADLGYRPNLVARGLRLQTTKVLAIVFPDVENPYFTAVCRGVEDYARDHKFSVLVCNTDEDWQRESEYVGILAAQSVAGVIIAPSSTEHTNLYPLTSRGISVVSLEFHLRMAADAVQADGHAGASVATLHLLENGATRVGCITGPVESSSAQQRLAGYQTALRILGKPVDDRLWLYADYYEDGGYDGAKHLLQLPEPPDALFVANNRMAMGAIRAIRDLGLRIPEDVSFVGFDEIPAADLIDPPITTVRQPTREIGQTAARMLVERIGGYAGPSREIALLPELLVRGSSVKPAQG